MFKESTRPLLPNRPENRLLRALPDPDFEQLRPHLTTIPTAPKQVLLKFGEPIDHVYFPNGGVASITAVMADGAMVEAVTVGLEGMVGIETFFGENAVASGEAIVQIAGSTAEMLRAGAFRRELERRGALFDIVGRYAQAAVSQMMQSIACNARHHIHERCARWLLMTHDRVGCDEFQLSHEFLSAMLGVRRQSVTVVARTLQAAQLIAYKHARIKILDRQGLEAAACECYGLVRSKFESLRS